jgi:hypothetical protein
MQQTMQAQDYANFLRATAGDGNSTDARKYNPAQAQNGLMEN